jgi:concentrative nucleoside transporter, CNT family
MMMDLLRGVLGLAVLVTIGICLSENRAAIRPRVVLSALALQVAIGALVLFVPWGRIALGDAASAVNEVIAYGNKGMEFMFGGLVGSRMRELFGDTAFGFAFRVLSAIIYMSALIAILYHVGLMRWLVAALGIVFQKLVGVSRLESFSAVTTIFLGQSEMPWRFPEDCCSPNSSVPAPSPAQSSSITCNSKSGLPRMSSRRRRPAPPSACALRSMWGRC